MLDSTYLNIVYLNDSIVHNIHIYELGIGIGRKTKGLH